MTCFGITDVIIGLPIVIIIVFIKLKLDKYMNSLRDDEEDDNKR